MAHAASMVVPSGLVLGRYRPIRPLGSGGSGSVWLARDEGSGLEVALKIVAREGKAAARAEREVAAASRLRHERCPRAYALAHDADHVYIAYEYVAGRTLREALRAGELDDDDAVEAAAQVLDGLAHAHERGIVHRDVKPSNVLLADGGPVSVRLLDFGLARMDEAETLTAAGDVPGTLAYIAPERLAGQPATPAADVWAVGVMLWEALGRGHPFWKPSLLESARAIGAGAPPLASVRGDLPKRLVVAVDRALSLEPRRRQGAAALAGALRASTVRGPSRKSSRAPDGRQTPRRLSKQAPGHPSRARPRRLPLAPPAPSPQLVSRGASALLAAIAAGWSATALPFYPAGGAFLLAALAGSATALTPRLGLALVLAVPVLPLGNLALGLALLYGVLALAWLALFLREPAGGLLVALGPLLGPLAALGLLPLAACWLRSPFRRAAAASVGVLTAVAAAGIRGVPLPLIGAPPPGKVVVAGEASTVAVASALWRVLAAHPALLVAAAVLALAAAALPHARALGRWGLAGWGAAVLAAGVIPAPEVAAMPLVVAIWATCAGLALRDAR